MVSSIKSGDGLHSSDEEESDVFVSAGAVASASLPRRRPPGIPLPPVPTVALSADSAITQQGDGASGIYMDMGIYDLIPDDEEASTAELERRVDDLESALAKMSEKLDRVRESKAEKNQARLWEEGRGARTKKLRKTSCSLSLGPQSSDKSTRRRNVSSSCAPADSIGETFLPSGRSDSLPARFRSLDLTSGYDAHVYDKPTGKRAFKTKYTQQQPNYSVTTTEPSSSTPEHSRKRIPSVRSLTSSFRSFSMKRLASKFSLSSSESIESSSFMGKRSSTEHMVEDKESPMKKVLLVQKNNNDVDKSRKDNKVKNSKTHSMGRVLTKFSLTSREMLQGNSSSSRIGNVPSVTISKEEEKTSNVDEVLDSARSIIIKLLHNCCSKEDLEKLVAVHLGVLGEILTSVEKETEKFSREKYRLATEIDWSRHDMSDLRSSRDVGKRVEHVIFDSESMSRINSIASSIIKSHYEEKGLGILRTTHTAIRRYVEDRYDDPKEMGKVVLEKAMHIAREVYSSLGVFAGVCLSYEESDNGPKSIVINSATAKLGYRVKVDRFSKCETTSSPSSSSSNKLEVELQSQEVSSSAIEDYNPSGMIVSIVKRKICVLLVNCAEKEVLDLLAMHCDNISKLLSLVYREINLLKKEVMADVESNGWSRYVLERTESVDEKIMSIERSLLTDERVGAINDSLMAIANNLHSKNKGRLSDLTKEALLSRKGCGATGEIEINEDELRRMVALIFSNIYTTLKVSCHIDTSTSVGCSGEIVISVMGVESHIGYGTSTIITGT